MSTLVLGTPPPELEALKQRRRRAELDRLDEVWEVVVASALLCGLVLLVDALAGGYAWP